jgi:hypothetical protein
MAVTNDPARKAKVTDKLVALVENDAHPPVIYRTAPDGTRSRCVWNPATEDYECQEIHADGLP